MRKKTHPKGQYRKFNVDWIDDWSWLFGPEPELEQIGEEIIVWTEQDVLHIADCLIQDSVRSLFDYRVAAKTAFEIHEWIVSENDNGPFSFENCCLLSGLNPDELRDTILDRLKRTRHLN